MGAVVPHGLIDAFRRDDRPAPPQGDELTPSAWLYAAIRPRFGAGPKTAALAGAVVWFFAYLYPSASMMIMHMFPRRMLAIGVLWGLFELVIATIAGASVYQE